MPEEEGRRLSLEKEREADAGCKEKYPAEDAVALHFPRKYRMAHRRHRLAVGILHLAVCGRQLEDEADQVVQAKKD